MWMDHRYCVWPDDMTETPAKYFSDLNSSRCDVIYDAPVITLSHMVPRRELILGELRTKSSNQTGWRNYKRSEELVTTFASLCEQYKVVT